MAGGIAGKLLRVDLSNNLVQDEPLPEGYLELYIGGDGLSARILYDQMPPGVNPLSPDAILVFAAGPLAGTSVQSGCNYSVAGLSPFNGYCIYNSHSNGYFAPRLKRSGYDAIVIKGKAKTPVSLLIKNGVAELRDASHLWGKDTWDTEEIIRNETGDPKISCACIGPAGENLILMAAIVNDRSHMAGRGGMGAVMGSKKLKAIAVSGNIPVPIADEKRFIELARRWRTENMAAKNTQNLARYGTAGLVPDVYSIGDLPIKNYTRGTFSGWEKLSGQYMVNNMFKRHLTCWNCTIAHCKILELKDGAFSGEHEMPEYEMIAATGSNIGVSDPTVSAIITENLDRNGLDGLATGNLIAFLMECYEKGLIDNKNVEGLDLKWGNYEAVLALIDKIVHRQGIGEVLAGGSLKAAEWVGKGSEKFVIQVKGMTLPMHDHRSRWGYALQYAIGSAGPAHESGFATFLGQTKATTEGQAEIVKGAQQLKCFVNALGVCNFATGGVTRELMAETLSAATGVDFSLEQCLEAGLRLMNLRRAFAVRHGLVPEYDTLPYRYLRDPLPDGPTKGRTVPIEPMVREYYDIMGWDHDTGKPLHQTLINLGLDDIARDLWGK